MKTPLQEVISYLDPIHCAVQAKAESLLVEEKRLFRLFFNLGKNSTTFEEAYEKVFTPELHQKPIAKPLNLET